MALMLKYSNEKRLNWTNIFILQYNSLLTYTEIKKKWEQVDQNAEVGCVLKILPKVLLNLPPKVVSN